MRPISPVGSGEPAGNVRHSVTGTTPSAEDSRQSDTAPPRRESPPPRVLPSDEYLIQICFDKNARAYVAGVGEFPELRATGTNRDAVLHEIQEKLEDFVENLRRQGGNLPEAYSAKRYPERLDLKISHGLFRRLDNLSRQEKVGIEQLALEILSAGVEKRHEPSKSHHHQDRRPQQQQGGGRHQHQGQGQRQQGQGQRQHRGRGYHESLENRENFLEYVRNLEKGGGGWRKK